MNVETNTGGDVVAVKNIKNHVTPKEMVGMVFTSVLTLGCIHLSDMEKTEIKGKCQIIR